MKNWFVCSVKYAKEDEQGKVKKVTEQYVVDALSFTEAEARIYEMLGGVLRGEFNIADIKRSNLVDIFHYPDADTWYKAKVVMYIPDEATGKEKKVANYMLVSAPDLRSACERVEESLSTVIAPYKIASLSESNYLEIFTYEDGAMSGEAIPTNLKPIGEAIAE